jgi:hypothetical protein
MALVLKDRVQETATANTTISFTMLGAATGYQSFSSIGNTNTTYYAATDISGNWEAGIGTYSTTGPTLTRTTILSSSNSGSAVTFVGTVTVFVTYPSGKSVNLDASGNVSALGTVASGTWNATTMAVAYGGTGVTTSTGSGNNVLSTSPTLVTPVLGTPTSGNLSSCTADGTNAVGYLVIPQNSQSAAYTLVLADAGKNIYHPSADTTARTWTIPANSSVAFPVGTAVTFINDTSAGVITIAITTDTLVLAKDGTTGSRTLAANGMATAIKMTSTRWMISGAGLT